jgi:hypothetical protein
MDDFVLFQVSVLTQAGDEFVHSEASLWIELIPAELLAKISGGSARAVGKNL